MFDLLFKNIVKIFVMIRGHVLMIHYEKKDLQVHIEICKFIVV